MSEGLAGKRVLVARAEGQTDASARLLRERGAEPVVIPSIAIGPPDDAAALREALTPARLAGVDWVVFTSANGVEHTWRALAEAGRGREVFAAARFAVVGAATREALEAHGASADVVAKEFRGEGVARALLDAIGETSAARPARVLLLRAQEASDIVPQALLAAGVEVDVVAAYRTRPSPEGAAESLPPAPRRAARRGRLLLGKHGRCGLRRARRRGRDRARQGHRGVHRSRHGGGGLCARRPRRRGSRGGHVPRRNRGPRGAFSRYLTPVGRPVILGAPLHPCH